MGGQNKWEFKRENRGIGVEREGTRDQGFRRNSKTLGSGCAISNPPDKKGAMTHLDEAEAH